MDTRGLLLNWSVVLYCEGKTKDYGGVMEKVTVDVLAYKSEGGVWLNAVLVGQKAAIMLPDRALEVSTALVDGGLTFDGDARAIANYILQLIPAEMARSVSEKLRQKAELAGVFQVGTDRRAELLN
jgi:hypothetical protein